MLTPTPTRFNGLIRHQSASTLEPEPAFQSLSAIPKNSLSHFTRSSLAAPVRSAAVTARRAKKPLIPKDLTFYKLSVKGTTYYGNTYVPQSNTQYTAYESFSLAGLLSVENGIRPAKSYRNGRNPRDLGFYVGNIPTLGIGNGTAGSASFVTNSKTLTRIGESDDADSTDVAFVGAVPGKGFLKARIDGNNFDGNPARLIQRNAFNAVSSFATSPKQILFGGIDLKFAQNGKKVSGRVTFYGSSSNEARAYAYFATITGELRQ
jgi:hypothetical protein